MKTLPRCVGDVESEDVCMYVCVFMYIELSEPVDGGKFRHKYWFLALNVTLLYLCGKLMKSIAYKTSCIIQIYVF